VGGDLDRYGVGPSGGDSTDEAGVRRAGGLPLSMPDPDDQPDRRDAAVITAVRAGQSVALALGPVLGAGV
jgi:hypothetical protein